MTLKSTPAAIFLVYPDMEDGNATRAQADAAEIQKTLNDWQSEFMMAAPCTAPASFGAFTHPKISVISWTGLKTLDIHSVYDDTKEKAVIEAAAQKLIDNKTLFELQLEDAPRRYLLGVEHNDGPLGGPVIAALNLESQRPVVNAVRKLLGVDEMHLDFSIHMTLCRITGKTGDGQRDDKALRDVAEPLWPKLSNGFPAVIEELPDKEADIMYFFKAPPIKVWKNLKPEK